MTSRRAALIFTVLFRAALTVGIGTSLVGCGFKIDIKKLLKKKKSGDGGESDEDEDDEDEIDLGTAKFPEGAKKPVAKHSWTADKLEPSEYELKYVMDEETQKQVLNAHQTFSKRAGYTDLGGGKFRWRLPPGCEPDMGCAFGAMSDANTEALKPVAERFRQRQKKANLKADKLASLIITFVQNIKYEEPHDQPFGILPPASVIAEKRGDCDSKSLLAHMLLREFGIDSVMLSSKAHRHAMLGVAIPAPGTRFKFGGREYAFTELTAKGSPIGHINPSLLQPDDWKVVPTRWPEASWSAAATP